MAPFSLSYLITRISQMLAISILLVTQSFGESRVWLPKIETVENWNTLALPQRDLEFTKFVIDTKSDNIYYLDEHVFTLHIDFVLGYLQKQERTKLNIALFNRNYSAKKPQYILGYLTHYPKIQMWAFSFWEGDAISVPDIVTAKKKLTETFLLGNLQFRPDSPKQEKLLPVLTKLGMATVRNDEIYAKLPYQAFQIGSATGKLTVVKPGTPVDTLSFDQSEIVVLPESYPDISPVAGIITTTFSTPLSHVNLRTTAWGIPNAAIRDAAPLFNRLAGKIVTYEVREDGYTLREATAVERASLQKKLQTRAITIPNVDLDFHQLTELSQISKEDAIRFGSKTANLGEIIHAKNLRNETQYIRDALQVVTGVSIEDGEAAKVNVPDGFGIPFSFYEDHIRVNGLERQIETMVTDNRFKSDAAWRRISLEKIQQAICAAPIPSSDLTEIVNQWQKQLHGIGVFVRSSTNAEDINGFNGAGLYDTVPNVVTADELEKAIKKVWASIWNARAVDERIHFGIPDEKVFPAVLVQQGINATAAGVLLTTDVWGHQPHTLTINAKWGLGLRVVEGKKVPEQILYDYENRGTRILSRSDESTMLIFDNKGGIKETQVPAENAILSEKRARTLGDAAVALTKVFPEYETLDIEWVLEGEKIWIVQARPYVVAQADDKVPAFMQDMAKIAKEMGENVEKMPSDAIKLIEGRWYIKGAFENDAQPCIDGFFYEFKPNGSAVNGESFGAHYEVKEYWIEISERKNKILIFRIGDAFYIRSRECILAKLVRGNTTTASEH